MLLKFTRLTKRTLCTSITPASLNNIFEPQLICNMSKEIIRTPRYDGRSKKRQWEDRRSDKGEGLDPDSKQPKIEGDKPSSEIIGEAVDRVKRRKFVLLMGYSGADYYGMQRNPNTRTIEEDLFKALLNVNLINEECYNQVQNMQFQRAARTDKGVSAARQVVSLKLAENIDLDKINENLPEVIRVFAYKRVTKGFNSKSQCDGRTYVYILPTVSFCKSGEEIDQSDYRASSETIQYVNEILAEFKGTKNFHNFTSGKKPNDPSANRFIRSFTCEEPFVRNGVQFAVLKVYGQSFMMHQIRKMVGLVLAIVRGQATKETLINAFKMEKINIPRAPGLGLMLDFVHYERYNNRYGADGMHDTLTWDSVEDDVVAFKEKYIYPNIVETEVKEHPMVDWLETKLSRHSYLDLKEDDDETEDSNTTDSVTLVTTETKVQSVNV